ncbi:MAG: glycoside hydrolase family 27 protein [Sedimentisphaerales bacterium]|jgi:hypothetical protein|nr:glycoside hydrolase family 27 protein [Sedimentisphaerales bacterium]HNY78395.1 glycoside hydrolase family 27 protein [Sedimentisphaerales bacterium]HOC63517.1 glycoside hydrolase family 27 protein [Sedimentisphaerales bacterium]HOH62862.1 glycoside hydrolase family 27 protein [Sedimentisphaerales bacterium]HQA91342.1 glycoside hydrolase family 27 protein [Sedimentisphaerales bacterium]
MNRIASEKTLTKSTIFVAFLLLGSAAVTRAADPLVGTWEFKFFLGDQEVTARAEFAKGADGAYRGTWTPVWPEDFQGDQPEFEVKLSDITLDGNKIEFVQTVSSPDWEFVLDYAGTLQSDKITGVFSGDQGDLEAVATRMASELSSGFWSWASTPPMGWNSWDCYGPTVTEAEVRANADYMAAHLQSHGWQYVVVDIRWFVENTKAHGYNQTDPRYVMDEYGRFLPAVNRFPSAAGGRGFKPLADYIHSKGLRFGIHVMRGIPVEAVRKNTPILGSSARATDVYSTEQQCPWLRDMYTIVADRPGAQEYYDSIFRLYASWDVDYVKIDDLSRPYHRAEIELIRKAIDGCGRPMVLSTSPGATPLEAAEHVKTHANLWRISDDFWDRWVDIVEMFERCRNWAPHVGPGHWPDADMLPLGRISIRGERGDDRRTRLTKDEQITLMTLWSIFRSPLMFGGDLPSNDKFTLSLLTNDEVLAVNQNSTNHRELYRHDGLIAWVADVPDAKDKYVALFNTRDASEAASVKVIFETVGLQGRCTVRDLWGRKDLGTFSDEFISPIPSHGAGLYRISQE